LRNPQSSKFQIRASSTKAKQFLWTAANKQNKTKQNKPKKREKQNPELSPSKKPVTIFLFPKITSALST
jgi:hypothetical protein